MGFMLRTSSNCLKMSSGPQPTRLSPRKFSEKIALLNKKEREANAKFEQIINEIHSTIQPQQAQRVQHCVDIQQATADSTRLGPQLSCDEFQAMIESTRYEAAHSDSLEEIERVYENLMKSVGQFDHPQAIDSSEQSAESNKECLQQQFSARTAADADHSTSNSVSTTANSMMPTEVPFYAQQHQQQRHRKQHNQFQGTNLDLNENHLSQWPLRARNINCIPCGPLKCTIRYERPLSNKSFSSSHNMLETHVSSSYLPQTNHNQEVCMSDSQTRARVVSFGSASRERVRGAPLAQHHLAGSGADHRQAEGASHGQDVGQRQRQYLEEPPADRCRQKSCSDPQLNVLAPAQYSLCPVDQCKSDNRLAISSAQHPTAPSVGHTTTPFNCCSNTASGPIASSDADQNSNTEYFVATKANPSSQTGQVSISPGGGHFHPCDTTTSSRTGQLPGIKICTIGDNGQQFAASHQRQVFNDEELCERDSSLPDISNLHFGNNLTGTSPEKHSHSYEPLNNWPPQHANGQFCPMKQDDTIQMVDSCEGLDGSWQQYNTPPSEVKMEVQTSEQLVSMSPDQAGQETACWSNNQPESSLHQQNSLKAGNNLSNSDCGFNLHGSSTHHQQGNLMICTSSELYNNIFRSRSHSNIDYLAKQMGGRAKRAHLCAQNLTQFEEHHTSQYCLQTAEQPLMNVRRIEELKAQGTSTSPLNSSSNLNSPQSDMNSPASSTTTEQCESAMLFANTTGQQDLYQTNAMASDGATQFLQYTPSSAAMLDLQQQRTHSKPNATFGASNQQGVQIITQQPAVRESFMVQGGEQTAVQPVCRPSTTLQTSLSNSASPSSTTADSLNYINNGR